MLLFGFFSSYATPTILARARPYALDTADIGRRISLPSPAPHGAAATPAWAYTRTGPRPASYTRSPPAARKSTPAPPRNRSGGAHSDTRLPGRVRVAAGFQYGG